MPGGDRTGPMGMGPRTGRQAGYCAGYAVPGFASSGYGGGFGSGRGGRRGCRNMFYMTGLPGWARVGLGGADTGMPPAGSHAMTREQELDLLKQQADQVAKTLDSIRQRINELESKAPQ